MVDADYIGAATGKVHRRRAFCSGACPQRKVGDRRFPLKGRNEVGFVRRGHWAFNWAFIRQKAGGSTAQPTPQTGYQPNRGKFLFITAGCNEAFLVTMIALAKAGESVILPSHPWPNLAEHSRPNTEWASIG